MQPYFSEMLGRAHRDELLRQAAKAPPRSSNRDQRTRCRATALIQAGWLHVRGGFRRVASPGDRRSARAATPVVDLTQSVQPELPRTYFEAHGGHVRPQVLQDSHEAT